MIISENKDVYEIQIVMLDGENKKVYYRYEDGAEIVGLRKMNGHVILYTDEGYKGIVSNGVITNIKKIALEVEDYRPVVNLLVWI